MQKVSAAFYFEDVPGDQVVDQVVDQGWGVYIHTVCC